MDNKILFQLGDGAFWLSVAIGGLGLLVIAGVLWFARWLKSQDAEWLPKPVETEGQTALQPSNKFDAQFIAHYLENRLEFGAGYGQTVLAILLVTVLGILLVTKTISSEAGLSLLSAIAGFVFAKGTAAHVSKSELETDKKNG